VLDAERPPGEQPRGPVEPAARDPGAPAEQDGVPCERARDVGGAELVVTVAVEPVRAFARVDRRVGIVEPPVREAGSLERHGIVVDAPDQRGRLLPRASRERFPRGGDDVTHGRSIARPVAFVVAAGLIPSRGLRAARTTLP
jgi:hypothetical protein